MMEHDDEVARAAQAMREYVAKGGRVQRLPPAGSPELMQAMDARRRAGPAGPSDDDAAAEPPAKPGATWRAQEGASISAHQHRARQPKG